MRYTPQILLCCAAWIGVFPSCFAKEPLDPELMKKFTKDVETVLSPTLVGELQGAQSNRSAINVEQTASRNPEQPSSTDQKKPQIQFDNQVYPYHYERTYHYQYPPNPQGDPSRPIGYTEHFYEPRFRPKSHATDSHDPAYYRSELYNPFGTSLNHNGNSNPNANLQTNSKASAQTAVDGDVKQMDNSGESEVLKGPTPPPQSSFAHPEIPTSPGHPYPFPSVDFGGYRHGVFDRPPIRTNYFRPSGDIGQQQKDRPGHYLPQGNGGFTESLHQRPVESYQPLPPLDSFQNYPSKEFQEYDDHRPALPESSPHRSLGPPFFGSFFPPGYHNPLYNGYQPSEHFNGLFSDNFTRNFPLRPSFGGFYPHPNYLPQPSPPTSAPGEAKPEEPVPPGGPGSQPIPTTNPDDPAAPVAAASNSNYELKLFFPAKDYNADHMLQPSRSEEFTYISKNFRF